MKFDYIIGNPPYNEETEGTSDKPIYNYFMDESFLLSDKVELITPGRFLFNAGKTPKEWNQRMLDDPHFRVLHYEHNSSSIFSNTDITGGIAITYRDKATVFGAIEVFSPFDEMNTMREKVLRYPSFSSFSDLIYAPESYKFTDALHADYPNVAYREENGQNVGILSKGHDYDIVTNVFEKLPFVFVDDADALKTECVKMVGLLNNKRCVKYIKKKYIKGNENFNYFKVILPKSNGSGAIGEVPKTQLIGDPMIGFPQMGHTQSFISIGAFAIKNDAENTLKYIKTKFARTLLGILKITQHNPKRTWRFVPIQDFSDSSDICWKESIREIDQQLYKKYRLTTEEIDFIESHVKEMD